MGDDKARKIRLLRLMNVYALVFLTACFLVSAPPGVAGDLKVVRGIVGTVTGSLIILGGGGSVDLAGVTIQNPSGKEVLISDITPGTKVGLYYRRGTLSSVLVYPSMVE